MESEIRDRLAKKMADRIGHGMREKCYVHAEVVEEFIKEEMAGSSVPFNAVLDGLSGSEAVYGLLAWLTCRDEAVTFSAKHNANIAAELAKQFCEENNLADPRDDYHTRLIHPKGEVAIAGRGKNKAV